MVLAVEPARAGKGNVVDVEIEAHADGIGGHEIVDVARLIESDLRVARTRRQGAEHSFGVLVFLFMILLHLLIILMNFAISRVIHLNLPSTAAFTIHTSQKTLTISYLVWAEYFAAAFPMGLIPPIAYHLTQIILDVFVAQRFRRAVEQATERPGLEPSHA